MSFYNLYAKEHSKQIDCAVSVCFFVCLCWGCY